MNMPFPYAVAVFGKVPKWARPSLLSAYTLGLLLWLITAHGQDYSFLHTFSGGDGSGPHFPALGGTTLYGTTGEGGASNYGTLFRLQTDASGFTVLRSFAGPTNDGATPYGLLTLSAGALYGVTVSGGASNHGTIFRLNSDGTGYSLLKSFTDPVTDGSSPSSGLALSGTVLYGTTSSGGVSNSGALFKLNTDGSGFMVLKSFTGEPPGTGTDNPDGGMPRGSLVIVDSTIYGATVYGGISGNGVIYKIGMDGSGFTILKEGNFADGAHFMIGLVCAEGTLFGAVPWGGGGLGALFRLNLDGSGYRVLKSFTGFDGVNPTSLMIAANTLYGTTANGGNGNQGVVFALGTDGSNFVLLKHFLGVGDGGSPSGLALSPPNLYGAAAGGVNSNCGGIFRMTLPLPALLRTPCSQTAETGSTVWFRGEADGLAPLIYNWVFNDTQLLSAGTNHSLSLTGIQSSQTGAYLLVVTNILGAVTSPPAFLSVVPPVPRRIVPGLLLTGQSQRTMNIDYTDALGAISDWTTFASLMMTNTTQWAFDLSTPLPGQRFYQAWQSGPASAAPSLQLSQVPALILTGAPGNSVRIDYINQFGLTDAWTTLDTVTLTSTIQLYFDVSSVGRPPRLWRLATLP